MERIFENEMEFGKELVEMEGEICDFVSRLETGEYKTILYNGQSPVTKDNLGLIECIIDDLNESSTTELIDNDTIIIHNENEIIELKGRKRMSDGEIFARRYLDECTGSGNLIIKDHEMQVEFHEDNFKNAKDFYKKCKDIVNIRQFLGDENDPIWRMNWDAFWMTYKNGSRELWQRA